MTWEVNSLEHPRFEYWVGKNYTATNLAGSELIRDLKHWLRDEFEEFIGENGELDFDVLIGRKADAYIEHSHDPDHEKPFVVIGHLAPKNSFDRQAPD